MPSLFFIGCIALLTGLSGCATVADHYHPEALNEAAMDALTQGDVGTARILIERAARIGPGNATIEHNRQLIVRGQKDGLSLRSQEAAPQEEKQAAKVLNLPAIWPEVMTK